MAIKSKTQRSLMLGFIASISLCGAVGIYCLVVGRLGRTEERILLTTATVGACSILAMAAAVPWERRRWHPIGPLGVIAVCGALAFSVVMIWADWGFRSGFDRAFGASWVLAVALPHIGLVSLARLRKQWSILQTGTAATALILAGLLIALILFDVNDDLWGRVAGILGIAVACGTISMPILHRMSAMHRREAVRTVELKLSIVCPRCQTQQEVGVGRSQCKQCSLRFAIEIEEESCRSCGYPLYQLQSAVCPECGTAISQAPGRT